MIDDKEEGRKGKVSFEYFVKESLERKRREKDSPRMSNGKRVPRK